MLPEQQIEQLIDHALRKNMTRIAILAAEDKFGQKLLTKIQDKLEQQNIAPAQIMILSDEILKNDDQLIPSIQNFTHYNDINNDDSQDPKLPPYEALILAGNSQFVLRTAPLLAYYDFSPDRVNYLGTNLWKRPELIAEPSLQGAFVTTVNLPKDQGFQTSWNKLMKTQTDMPNIMTRLGYDAMAVVAVTGKSAMTAADWQTALTQKSGFQGLTGHFTLLKNGQNQRNYTINKLTP